MGPAGGGRLQFRPQVSLPVCGHSTPSPQFHPGTGGSTEFSSQPTLPQSLPPGSWLVCLLFSRKPLLYRDRDHQNLRVGLSSAQDQCEGSPCTQHTALELKETPCEFLHVTLTMALKVEAKLSPLHLSWEYWPWDLTARGIRAGILAQPLSNM